MKIFDAEIIFQPDGEHLRYLPEGPYPCVDGRVSWVAIQHGPGADHGSLNLVDLETGLNTHYPLPGRPGFAFPTTRPDEFVIGLERRVVLYNTQSSSITPISDEVDTDVTGTIINDGMVWRDDLVFGCKDVKFAEQKAGLYVLRSGRCRATQLRDDQVCSNGKAIAVGADGQLTLYDICSWTRQVVAWTVEPNWSGVRDRRVIVDLTLEGVFPDGMIMTPDGQSLIVALYDPRDRQVGEARQYGIASGEVEAVWRCDGSPRVTCPQLVRRSGRVWLVLTTADEGMEPGLRQKCPHAGCWFGAPTDLAGLGAVPPYPVLGGAAGREAAPGAAAQSA